MIKIITRISLFTFRQNKVAVLLNDSKTLPGFEINSNSLIQEQLKKYLNNDWLNLRLLQVSDIMEDGNLTIILNYGGHVPSITSLPQFNNFDYLDNLLQNENFPPIDKYSLNISSKNI